MYSGRLVLALLISNIPSMALVAAEKLPAIRVSDDKTHFADESGAAFRPMGFNYDHDASGRLIEDYWHTEWDRVENDFADMKELGANVVRIHLQFGRFMSTESAANEAELRQLERLLKLAEETRLYLDLTGLGCYHKKDVPSWYDELNEAARWKSQQVFWEAVASVCKDSSAVFCYDLMNEPVIGGEKPGNDWLGPAFGDKHFVQFVVQGTAGRTRPEAARQWIDSMVAAVRKHDSRHLVTVGFVDWSLARPGLTSGFVPEQVADNLDFLAVHIYPKASKAEEALATLKGFNIGKPVIVEETFPLGCSMEELDSFIDKSGDDADGWISFFWGKMPAEYEPPGSIGDAVTSKWLSQFSTRMKAESDVRTKQPGSCDQSAFDHDSCDCQSGSTASPLTFDAPELPFDLVKNFAQHSRMHSDGNTAFSVDLSAWSEELRDLPIGVFDSGIGGLTVQEAIFSMDAFNNDNLSPGPDGRKDFENERFIYFGDQANMPYGNYPSVERRDFLKELILKDAAFLLGKRYWAAPDAIEPRLDKPPVKAIVIACNTATAWGLEEIRELISIWKIPVFVVGVVEAGARGVTEVIESDGKQRTVAVLATVGTCASNAYPKAIGRSVGQAGKQLPIMIQQGSLGLAAAVEGDPAFISSELGGGTGRSSYLGPSVENQKAALDAANLKDYGFDSAGLRGDPELPNSLRLNSIENYVRYDVATLVKNYKASGKTSAIDTVVLGCTHFPLVQNEILSAFARMRAYETNGETPFKSLIAESIAIVDPAELTAKELFRETARRKLLRKSSADSPKSGDLFFISIANQNCPQAVINSDQSLDRDYKYSRDPGHLEIEDTICVPMKIELLPESSVSLIRSRLPEVWRRMQSSSEQN